LTNDWLPSVDRLRVLNPILEVLGDGPLSSGGPGLNPNSIGSVIAMLLPLQIFALRHVRRWVSGVGVAISLVALLLSGARGAWLALALAAFAWAVWIVISARAANRRQARVIWLSFALGGGLACVAVMALTPLGGWLLERSGDRANIWQNSLSLVRDYPFTGMGLGSYEMAYASYALLTHVGYVAHAHNLPLDVWLNWRLGLIALLGLTVNAMWPGHRHWRSAAWLMSVMLVHGIVDDTLWGSVILIPGCLCHWPCSFALPHRRPLRRAVASSLLGRFG
jgi:O-antigen ligase